MSYDLRVWGRQAPNLDECFPSSVPRRYGLWEPPQYKTEETGS